MAEGYEPRPVSDVFGNQIYLSGQTAEEIFQYTKKRGAFIFSSAGDVSSLIINIPYSGVRNGFMIYNPSQNFVEGIISIQSSAKIYSFRINSDYTITNIKSVTLS